MAKPITDTLRMLQGGTFMDTTSEQFAQLVKGVDETGKAGKLVITLDVKRVSGTIQILSDVKTKVPETKPEADTFWATVEGNLTVQNPRQQNLPLQAVDTRPDSFVDVERRTAV